MAKLTREDLQKLRTDKKKEMDMSDPSKNEVQITIGMGTSGIASGARETFEAFQEEIKEHDLKHVILKSSGGIGLDHAEPTVEVQMAGMPAIIYGQVTPAIAGKIVRKHIIGKTLVNAHVYDRPAIDIVREWGKV
jgi:NADP-reducing hydrogenase subunit HndB